MFDVIFIIEDYEELGKPVNRNFRKFQIKCSFNGECTTDEQTGITRNLANTDNAYRKHTNNLYKPKNEEKKTGKLSTFF